LEFRQLKYFVALARTKTFSDAAERVHVSQPALSQQIKKLETELDADLVERMGKQVKLTDQGEQFLPEAMQVLDALRSATSAVTTSDDFDGGTIKLGIIPTIAPYFLPSMMDQLNPAEKNLEVQIQEQQTETLIDQLKIGEVDHLLFSPPIPEQGLTSRTIGSEPFYLAVSSDEPVAERDTISIQDITDEPILLLEEGHCLRDQTLSFCERKNVTPNVVFQGSSLQSILNLIETGFGYSFVPEMVVQQDHPSVSFIPFEDPKPQREIILTRRQSTNLTALDRHIYDIVEEWFQRDEEGSAINSQ
jgi:LysR family hydrogen peroxide-inducible transcriptional activator